MIESMEMTQAADWEVRPSSSEFLNLDQEVRGKIDGYLSEYPVKLGAIASALGVKVLLSTLPRGTSGQIGQEDGEFVIRVNRHEANRLASDLIIPSALLAAAVKDYSGPMTDEIIEDLARRFGVSTTAMEIKLQMT